MLAFDHLAVAALSLEAGVAHVEAQLGVRVPPGGTHQLMGTHNHVMRLGDGIYLEIIAPDPSVTPTRPRWFALDDPQMRAALAVKPRIVNWATRTENIAQAMTQIPRATGEQLRMSRGDLSWMINVAADGSMTDDGAFPSIIEWIGNHPSSRMADLGCSLVTFEVQHPEAAAIERAVSLNDLRVKFKDAPSVSLTAIIDTPNGRRSLS